MNTNLIHNQIIFEMRYKDGYEYFDKSGKTIKDIIAQNPYFELHSFNKGFVLFDYKNNITIEFTSNRFWIMQIQSSKVHKLMGDKEFSELTKSITNILINNLNIKQLIRYSCRNIHLKSIKDAKEAISWIKENSVLNDQKLNNVDNYSFMFTFNEKKHKLLHNIYTGKSKMQIDNKLLMQATQDVKKLPENRKEATLEQIKAKQKLTYYPKYSIVFDNDMIYELYEPNQHIEIDKFICNCYELSLNKNFELWGVK